LSLLKNFSFCFFALIGFSFPLSSLELVDLETTFASKIVIESKQIHIPNYPHAFNSSFVRWKNWILMSFRIIPDRKKNFTSYIGLVWLNLDFEPIGEPQFVDPRNYPTDVEFRADDARLLTVGNKLYMVYSDCEDATVTKGGFRVYVSELIEEDGFFKLKDPERLSRFEGANSSTREKNWVPFDYQGNLLLAYSIVPHLILKPSLGQSNSCKTIATTNNPFSTWRWGIPRGGTPGVRFGDKYLSLFHSSVKMRTVHSGNAEVTHYFMGAYTYDTEPPFAVRQVSQQPIVGENFYHGEDHKPYWKPVKVVFPCGLISDEDFVWVTYGRDDHEVWVAKLDPRALLESLIPVEIQ
jgi:predicted GH43/DUF377 family glycosyl hydrolase